ncbi:MAG TPA: HAMP domain-containing sensor histidine kinase [Oscillatoriaceae cyanobacterium]
MRFPWLVRFTCSVLFTLGVFSITAGYAYLYIIYGRAGGDFSVRYEGMPRFAASVRPVAQALLADFKAHIPPADLALPQGKPQATLARMLSYRYVGTAYFLSPDRTLYVATRTPKGIDAFQQDLMVWHPVYYGNTYIWRFKRAEFGKTSPQVAHDRLIRAILDGTPLVLTRSRLRAHVTTAGNVAFQRGDPRHGYMGYFVSREAVDAEGNRLLAAAGLGVTSEMTEFRGSWWEVQAPGVLGDAFAIEPTGHGDDDMRATADRTFAVRLGALGLCLILGVLAVGQSLRTVLGDQTIALAKSNFVSAVSHEMRTPLTTIKLYAEMLEQGVVEQAEKRQDYLKTITQECDRLTRLIENVLDFAKISGRRRAYRFEETDVRELLEEAVTALRGPLERTGMTIAIECPDGLQASLDRDAVTQAIVNLLSNALKYAPSDRGVRLIAEMEDSELVISVRDFGPGIPKRERHRIFKPFYRMGDELTRQASGTGLGLALVMEYAKAHRGKVELVSHPGAGATFRLLLPQTRKTA